MTNRTVNAPTMLDQDQVTHRGYTYAATLGNKLAEARGELPYELPITFFPPGYPPRGGSEENPVTDSEQEWQTFEFWGSWFKRQSRRTIAKGKRPMVLGTSRYGGSGDSEAENILWLTCDSDKNERPENLLITLKRAGLSYIFQSREDENEIKWHLHLPLATPLDEESKPLFSEKYHFALGYLGCLGGLRVGLDAAMGNRRLQPVYIYTHRPGDSDDLRVHTEYHSAGALDLDRLLELVAWQPLSPRLPLRRAETIPGEQATAPDLAGAFGAAGLVLPRRGQKKWVDVICPWAENHSNPKDDTAGVSVETGHFKCFHSSCSNKKTRDVKQWLRENYPAAARDFIDHGQNQTNLKALIREVEAPLASELVEVDSDSLADTVRETVLEAEPGTITVISVPTGGGKTEGALDAVRELRAGIILSPSNALAEEIESRLLMKGAITERHKGVLAAKNPSEKEKEYSCFKWEEAKALEKIKLSVPNNLCSGCEYKKECSAAQPVGKGSVLIAPHAMAPGMARLIRKKQEQKTISSNPPLIIDEDFAPFEHTNLYRTNLNKAVDLIERGDVDDDGPMLPSLVSAQYRSAVAPWLRVLQLAWDLQSLEAGYKLYAEEYGPNALGSLEEVRETARNAPLKVLRRGVNPTLFRSALDSLARCVTGAWHLKWSTKGECHSAFQPSAVYRAVKAYEGPVIILSATPDLQYWEAQGAKIVQLDIPENPKLVQRHMCYMTDSHRRGLNSEVGIERVRQKITKALRICRNRLGADAQGALVVVAKPIADELREDPIVVSGLNIDVEHYGSIRGIDKWRDYQYCITVGEDWPNVLTNRLESEELGIDAFERAKWVIRSELDQVHGRLRDPRRKTPCVHVHVGSVLPTSWVGKRSPQLHGKGLPSSEKDRDLVARLLEFCGPKRGAPYRAAERIGVPRTSLIRYRDGKSKLPFEVRTKIEKILAKG